MGIKLGALVKSLRKELGLTTAQLSELTGISRGYVSNIETGKKIPQPEVLKKLVEHFPNSSYAHLLEAAGYEELATYEKMKSLEEDFGDKFNEELVEVTPDFLKNVGELLELLRLENYEMINNDILPSYNGHKLTEQDRKRILKMLEILFPEYQDKK